MTQKGVTYRDRSINITKQNLIDKACNSPSYKTIVLGENEKGVLVRDTTDPHTKKLILYPEQIGQNETINVGSILVFKDRPSENPWIVVKVDQDNDVTCNATIEQCNHLFRFQNNTSTILEYWGILKDPYSSQLETDKFITTRSNKLQGTLPYNEDTKKIFIDKRIYIESVYTDEQKEIPVVYKVTDVNSEISSYGNGKLLEIKLEFVSAKDNDSVEQKIADYISSSHPPSSVDPVKDLKCEIIGRKEIRIGGSERIYEAVFYSNYGSTPNQDVVAKWSLVTLPEFAKNIKMASNSKNSISVKADYVEALVGSKFRVLLTDTDGVYPVFEFEVEVVA